MTARELAIWRIAHRSAHVATEHRDCPYCRPGHFLGVLFAGLRLPA